MWREAGQQERGSATAGPHSTEDEVSGRSAEGRFEKTTGVDQVPRSSDKVPGEDRGVLAQERPTGGQAGAGVEGREAEDGQHSSW